MLKKIHGRSMYIWEGCRCDICTTAHRDYTRQYREARRKREPGWIAGKRIDSD